VVVERGDRDVVSLVKRERLAGRPPVTSGGVVAQVWRGGRGRQAELARLLAGVHVAAVDDQLGRRAGMLLARSGQSDATGATVVCLAADGDHILSWPESLGGGRGAARPGRVGAGLRVPPADLWGSGSGPCSSAGG
jgi:hypothetical protein